MKKILFYVDHKFRDLPSLAKIGFLLENKGFKIYYAPLWLWEVSIDKDIIVLNKPIFEEAYRKYNWKDKKIIIIESEGCNQDFPKFKRKVLMKVDLYFFWSNFEKKKYLKNPNIEKKIVGGCPRMDFIFEKNYSKKDSIDIISRKILLKDIRKKKIITIATSTQEAHLDSNKIEAVFIKRKKVFISSMDYLKHVRNSKLNLKFTLNILKKIKKIIKDDYIILLKPHPNENHFFWEKKIKNFGKNFFLLKDILINDLINVSDFHISHNGCTTTFEAKLKNIPCAEIHNRFTKFLIHPDHLSLPDVKIKSLNDIHRIFKRLNQNDLHFKKINSRYIDKYYFKIDNKRCDFYANEINKFIKQTDCDVKLKLNFNLLKFFFLGKLKEYYNFIRLSFIMVDHRQRYNSRIKINDHKFWYKTFRKII